MVLSRSILSGRVRRLPVVSGSIVGVLLVRVSFCVFDNSSVVISNTAYVLWAVVSLYCVLCFFVVVGLSVLVQ